MPNERVLRSASSVARQESGSFSYKARSLMMERIRGASKVFGQRERKRSVAIGMVNTFLLRITDCWLVGGNGRSHCNNVSSTLNYV